MQRGNAEIYCWSGWADHLGEQGARVADVMMGDVYGAVLVVQCCLCSDAARV